MGPVKFSDKPNLTSSLNVESNYTSPTTDSSASDSFSVTSQDDMSSRPSPSTSIQPFEPSMCPSHRGEDLSAFCHDCQLALCDTCVTDVTHLQHRVTPLSGAEEGVSHGEEAFHRLVEKVTLQLPCIKEAMCDLTDLFQQLDSNRSTCEEEIRRCFDSLRSLVNLRESELLEVLRREIVTKKKVIETQFEELENWVASVEGSCEYVENTLSDLPPREANLARTQIGHKLRVLSDVEFPPVLRENSHVRFVEGRSDYLKNTVKSVGKVQTNSAIPQQTTAIGDALKKVFVERQSVVTVVTRDHKGVRIKTGGAEVRGTLCKNVVVTNGLNNNNNNNSSHCHDEKKLLERSMKPRKDLSTPVQIVDLNDGTYEVFFTVSSIGTYTLSIFLHGSHISASPFNIIARMPTDTPGGTGSENGSWHCDETSFIRRKSLNTIQISRKSSFSSNKHAPSHRSSCSRRTLKEPLEDDLIMRVGRKGRGKGEFVNPQGICFAPVKDGRIAVADSNNQCIQVFDLTGECRVKFGTRGRGVGQLQRPTGVCSLPDGNYAVADYENRWVSIFEPSGKFVRRIGQGKLLGPKGMCVNSDGNLVVVDNKASSVFIFSLSGKVLKKFGNRTLDGYNFAGPHFCAVNSWGDIIVTDFHNHCVRVFSSEAEAKFSFGTNGEGNGQFNAPTGVAVDGNHNIIVADWGNSRIQVFDSQGSFLSFVSTLADPLYGPQGLSLTPDGHIVVADSGNHCFKIYKYLQ